MSASISPPYNPQIIPVRAKQLAGELRQIAEDSNNSWARHEQMEFLNAVHWVRNLSDAVLVQVIAESVPETSITVDDIYRVESWDELTSLVFDEYLDDPVRDLFQKMAIEQSAQMFEIPVEQSPVMSPMSEGDEFPLNEMTYETKTLEMNRYNTSTVLGITGRRYSSLNEIADEFARMVVDGLVDKLPDRDEFEYGRSIDDIVYDSMMQINKSGGRADSMVMHPDIELGDDMELMLSDMINSDIQTSEYLQPQTAILADTDRMGYEGIWSEDDIGVFDPAIRRYGKTDADAFNPIQIDYRQRTNGIVLDDDAVQHIRV